MKPSDLDTKFHETQKLIKHAKLGFLVLAIFLLGALMAISGYSGGGDSSKTVLFSVAGFTTFLFLLVLLLKFEIVITNAGILTIKLKAVFTIKTYTFDLKKEIKVSYPSVNALRDFGGWGIRYNFSKEVGLIFSGNQYVKVEQLVFTIDDLDGFKEVVGEVQPI